MKPSVGRIVHYVSYGTPGGEYPSLCRAATVTEIDGTDPTRVGLCVQNPTGLFFQSLAAGGSDQHELEYDTVRLRTVEDHHRGGTWHWPERTPE